MTDLDVLGELSSATTIRALERGNPADVRSGTVQNFDAVAAVAQVVLDGDDNAVELPVVGSIPLSPGVRVMCFVTKPHGGHVYGREGGHPNYLTTSIAGTIGAVAAALTVMATIQGPIFKATKVSVAYIGKVEIVWNGVATTVVLLPEISLNGGSSWIAGPQSRFAVTSDNSIVTIPFGAGRVGSGGNVMARLSTSAGAGGTQIGDYFHEIRTVAAP